MAPIVVEPEVLAGAGVSISSVGDAVAAELRTLASALPGGAMAGHDTAGLAFGQAYKQAAQALLNAGAAAVTGGRKVGFGVQTSATNYSRADASSTIGGESALTPPTAPSGCEAPSVPSQFGGGVAEPFLWSMVQMLVGGVWPDGDPAQLRAAAGAWSSFASTLSTIGAQLEGPSAVISGQQIPEGGAMGTAISDLKQGLSGIVTESVKLSTQVFEFAADVEAAQNAIRDLLGRLSPAGIIDGLQAIFSGDAMEELREIAHDIREVLHILKRQADARQQSMQDVMQMIDDAVVSLEKNARKEFTDFLGDDVGNAVATVFDTQLNVPEGVLKAGMGALEDLQQLNPLRFAYDFEGAKDTWGTMLETNFNASVVGSIMNPGRAAKTQMEMLKGLVHADDWTTDRPGLGLGENIFDVGSALFGGAGAARTGTRAAGEAADAAEGAGPAVRAAGSVDNALPDTTAITGRTESIADSLDDVGDNIQTRATPNASGPSVPPSLTEPPGAPRVGDTPTPRPHAPDAPTPDVPDSTQVDRSRTPAQSSTPTSTPAGPGDAPRTGTPPIGEMPESRVKAAVEAPLAPHQTAPTPSSSSVPTNAAPPVASHGQEAPRAGAAHAPASGSTEVPAPPRGDAPLTSPDPGSTSNGTTQVHPDATPDGVGSHRADSGNSGSPHPNGEDPSDPTDSPNKPPHTGLHGPPATHATPGDRLPDLTDINNEYRRPDGAVDTNRFHEWAEKVAEAYPTITKDGVEGVYNYTTEKYDGMNPYLRNIDSLSPEQSEILGSTSISDMTDAQRASLEAQIKQTDEGLAALPPYRADLADTTSTTWRGIQASDSVLDHLKVGDTFSDSGYLSTTTSPHVAEAFARADPDATPTLVTVVGRDGVDVKDLSRFMDESEILFPRSTEFEVVFREMGPDGLLRITVRQIDP